MEIWWNAFFASLRFSKRNFGEKSCRNSVQISLDKSLKSFAFETQIASRCFVKVSRKFDISDELASVIVESLFRRCLSFPD